MSTTFSNLVEMSSCELEILLAGLRVEIAIAKAIAADGWYVSGLEAQYLVIRNHLTNRFN